MKKILYSSVVLGLVATSASAFDYKVSGSAESFTKWGFNNQKLNKESGAAPTESFTTIFSQLNLNLDLGAGFKAGFGGAIGGLAFDSTDGKDPNQPFSAVRNAYYGVSWDRNNNNGKIQNYMFQNAFVEYDNNTFYVKAGRYESGKVGEWFSGYNQGAEAALNISALKVWGFLSNRRAFAYDRWFNDFYRVHGKYNDSIATRNTYAAGLDLNFGGLTIGAFSYFTPGHFTAPGANVTFQSNPSFEGQGFNATTKIRFLAPIADENKIGTQSGRDWGEIGKYSYTLYIDQRFDVDKLFFGVGYYQNFGNANELIGRWGNPIGIDIWTAGAYDIGNALNDIIGRNAITGFGYLGANYGSFDWKFIGRGTNSPRSAEQSVALLLNYQIREDIAIGGKLEWFSDTTKAGYKSIVWGDAKQSEYGGGKSDTKKRTDDRSHAFFYIRHTF